MDVYKEMSKGTAQINPLSDYFQESEKDMKTKTDLFNGEGYNLGYGVPVYEFDKEDKYDYSKPVTFDYSRQE